jgi:hypothetical protein
VSRGVREVRRAGSRTVRRPFCLALDRGASASCLAVALHYFQQPSPPGFDSWDAALDAWGVAAEHRNDRAAFIDPDGAGPRLIFQKVPEPKPK